MTAERTDSLPTNPLRIGILGAARIAGIAIVEPAAALGHRLVAVAARDRQRAEAYAAKQARELIGRVVVSVPEAPSEPRAAVPRPSRRSRFSACP